jgi:hypothetical protein
MGSYGMSDLVRRAGWLRWERWVAKLDGMGG